MFSRTGVADLANKPVGTGPYQLAAWKRGDSIRLDANPKYWGTKPALPAVTLKYFKDATAMNNALLTGGIDVISNVQAPESLQQFADPNRFQTVEGTTNGEVVLSMNNGRAPFDDKKVRQAVRHAIDHKALLDTAWAGRGQPIGSMVSPTDPWYEDRTGDYPYDVAKAKALLGGKTYTVKMRIPNLPYAVASAQVVKSQLAQVGITADIEPLEFPARWLDVVFKQADYDLSIINHIEPRDMGIFADKSYYFRYDNPEFGKLLASADEGTEQQQADDLKKAAKLLSDDAAADWLFLFPNLIVAEKGVTGLPKNAISESFDFTGLAKQ
ncbi:MAG: peptide transporter substrate-binding protein [Nonomuraea muscovyensis]|nr:peptide transporter substrate-binding protein [Nonomuraea muscovyensis]